MANYVSFLKTISLKLNSRTIQFFFNGMRNTFPLYTEAIKFYDSKESMVRVAVKTLTLNVYRGTIDAGVFPSMISSTDLF